MDQFIIESDYMVQCMHVIGTESALTRICWFFKPWQGHFYLKRFLSFQLFNHSFNKYSSQTLCHFIHPFLRKTSMVSAAITETVDWQQWHNPKVCSLWLLPLYPPPWTQTFGELWADSRKGRTILYSSQTSLKGNDTILTHLSRGRRKEYEVEFILICKV